MKVRNTESGQFSLLVLTALLTDCFIRPFGLREPALSARGEIFCSLIVLLIWLALFLTAACGQEKRSRTGSLILCGALLLSAALQILQGQRLYGLAMERQPAPGVFLLICLAAAGYGAQAELSSLSRAAGAVLLFAGLSAAVMLISLLPQLHFVNLGTEPVGLRQLAQETDGVLYLPAELVLFTVLGSKERKKHRLTGIAAVFTAVSCLLALLAEMTLGTSYAGHSLPLYTAARLGGISVFRRLDALHVGVWLLLLLLKISLMMAGTELLLRESLPALSRRAAGAGIAVLIAVCSLLVMLPGTEALAFGIQQSLLAAGLLWRSLPEKQKKEKQE